MPSAPTFAHRAYWRTHHVHGFAMRHVETVGDVRYCTADYSREFSLRSHYHSDLFFDFVVSGSGIERRSREDIICTPGTMTITPPGEAHDLRPGPEGLRVFSVMFFTEWLEAMGYSIGTRSLASTAPAAAVCAARLLVATSQLDRSRALDIEEQYLHLLMAVLGHRPALVDRHRPQWLDRVVECLHDTACVDLTLRDLADEAGVHFTHLARAFRLHEGCTIGAYQRRLRLGAAVRALARTTQPLAIVAVDAGFCDQSHFNRWFKREIGVTPLAYRRIARS